MCKKLFSFVSLLLVLSAVSTSYGVVMSDFEDGLDGWEANPPWRSGKISLSATGATQGSAQAMLVEGPGAWQQVANIGLKPYASALANQGVSIAADVTAFPADMTTDWMQVGMVVNAEGAIGWSDLGLQGVTLDGQPQTIEWPLSDELVAKIAEGPTETLGWFEVVLISNVGGSVVKFYVDNVRINGVPIPPKIIYVTSIKDNDQDGVQDDTSWKDWLEAEGYDVDFRPGYWNDPLDANEIAELNAADLVIAARGMATGDFDGAETPKWNGVTTPMICTNAWMIRNNRWKWLNTGTANKDAGAPIMLVDDPNHPIFAGLPVDGDGLLDILDPNAGSGHTSFNTDFLDPGNGVLLSMSLGKYTTAWIVEWQAGVEYYAGAAQVAAGKRMLFMAGTQDDPYTVASGAIQPVGVFNLNAAGQQLLRNIIAYMMAKKEIAVAGELLVDVSAADPSAGTAVWVNNGTLGDFTYISGPNDLPAGSKVMTPDPNGPAVEEFEGVPVVNILSTKTALIAYKGPLSVPGIEGASDRSIEAWVADVNTIPDSQAIIAWGYRGNAKSCCFSYGSRNTFGALIHYSDPVDVPWGNNFNAPKVDNVRPPADETPALGVLHHLVYTYDGATTVKLYRDGQLVVTRTLGQALDTGAALAINLFIQNNSADGALSDNSLPASMLVNSIRVHDGVLTDEQVLNNFEVGPAK